MNDKIKVYVGMDMYPLYVDVKPGVDVQACRVFEDLPFAYKVYAFPSPHYVAVANGEPCLDLSGNVMMFGRASIAKKVAEQFAAKMSA